MKKGMKEKNPFEYLELMDAETETGKLHTLLESALLDPTEVIDEEPAYIYAEVLEGQPRAMLTKGNISVVSGQAKSRKTFLCSAIAAAAATSGTGKKICYLSGNLPEEKRTVLYFDTEQSKHHAQRVNKRILALMGKEKTDNFYYYKLRGHDAKTCLDLVYYAVGHVHQNKVGFILIDGISDLLSEGVNDPKETDSLIKGFMKMSEENSIHICTVLHLNKAKRGQDATLTGWAGTHLLKKADSIIEVSKDETRTGVSNVRAKDTREMEFEPFSFEVAPDGLPYPTTSPQPAKKKETRSIWDLLQPSIFENGEELKDTKHLVNFLSGLSYGKPKTPFMNVFEERLKTFEETRELNVTTRRKTEFYERLMKEKILLVRLQPDGKTKLIQANSVHPLFSQISIDFQE